MMCITKKMSAANLLGALGAVLVVCSAPLYVHAQCVIPGDAGDGSVSAVVNADGTPADPDAASDSPEVILDPDCIMAGGIEDLEDGSGLENPDVIFYNTGGGKSAKSALLASIRKAKAAQNPQSRKQALIVLNARAKALLGVNSGKKKLMVERIKQLAALTLTSTVGTGKLLKRLGNLAASL